MHYITDGADNLAYMDERGGFLSFCFNYIMYMYIMYFGIALVTRVPELSKLWIMYNGGKVALSPFCLVGRVDLFFFIFSR